LDANPPSEVVSLVISVAKVESVTTIPGTAGAALQLSLPLMLKEVPAKVVSVADALESGRFVAPSPKLPRET
jgi:hypothetical protein